LKQKAGLQFSCVVFRGFSRYIKPIARGLFAMLKIFLVSLGTSVVVSGGMIYASKNVEAVKKVLG
jgi:hypothetical protein